MATSKSLELALRIRADLQQGQVALDRLGASVEGVGEKASQAQRHLKGVGESADQQAVRLKAMVAASLSQQAAQDSVAVSARRLGSVVQASNRDWQASVRAQTAVLKTYHNAERATRAMAVAEQRAAEQVAKVSRNQGRREARLGR